MKLRLVIDALFSDKRTVRHSLRLSKSFGAVVVFWHGDCCLLIKGEVSG